MLRNRLLGGVSWLPLFAADDDGGAADPPTGGAEGAADPPAQGGAAPPAEGAEGAADPPAEGGEPPPAEGAAPPAPSADWRDREIRRKHAQLQQEKTARQQLENELETARALLSRRPAAEGAGGEAAPPPAAPAAGPLPPEEVQRAAAQMVAQQNFEKASSDAFNSGVTKYGADKFKETIDRIEVLGGFDPDTLNGILATDDPAKVIFELGTKPDEYRRIMDLPSHRRLAEMVKLGLSTPAPKKKVSDAPPPAEGIRGQNRPDGNELRDDLTDEEWYARRDRQRAAAFAAKKQAAAQ